ncbi:MAG: hypothetical protein KC503_37910 [Myxococcales bacterium]|nr:hypothetical protein [Myxococcales bacterium]
MRRCGFARAVAAAALLLASSGSVARAQRAIGYTSGAHAAGEITLRAAKVLSEKGQALDGEWRFFPGDDTRLAARELPSGVSMGKPWHSMMGKVPPDFPARGWFRMRVIVPESLQGRPLALALRYRGAVEIYVDGDRIARFGRFGRPSSEPPIVACFHPRVVRVTFGGASHVIAVRFESTWARRLAGLGFGGGVSIAVGERAKLKRYWEGLWGQVARLHVFFYGVTMGLATLHFLLFIFYRERPANLYFAVAAASIGMLARGIEMSSVAQTASGIVHGNALFNASAAMACVFSQRFYYESFLERPPRYYILFVLAGAGIVAGAYWIPFSALYGYALASFAEQLLTLGRAVLARKRGSGIIAAGGVAAAVLTTFTIFVDLGYFGGNPDMFLYGFLALSASMSVHLAREIALDKRSLAEQLAEIQRLSQQTLEREREAAEERLARDAAAAANKQRELSLVEARKRQEAVDALDHANKELSRTQAQLVQTEKLASLGELVDGVAREMDEPVAHIVQRADELQRAHAALTAALASSAAACDDRRLQRSLAALTEAARVIDDGGQRVAAIAERLAQFARVEAPQNETLQVEELVDGAVQLLEGRFAAAGVQLEREGLADVSPLTGHRRQLVVLLRQLLDNALQAVAEREGERRISVRARQDDEDGVIAIAISDNGPGVPQRDRARIFDPGFTTRGVGVGAGLGLAIAYRVARAHGGELTLAEPSLWPGDRSPAGATFVVALPIDAKSREG